VPFLDSRVAEIAYRVPGEMLIDRINEKKLLRSMAERHGLLPPEILQRKKFGAGVAANWMDDSPAFMQYARDVILQEDSLVDELGLRRPMQRYFEQNKPGYSFPRAISIFRNLAWRLLILNLWSKTYRVSPDHA
jgi:asparagine synthetase B (glutamine-hydrolysing)